MDAGIEKECGALGGLFQLIMTDMKMGVKGQNDRALQQEKAITQVLSLDKKAQCLILSGYPRLGVHSQGPWASAEARERTRKIWRKRISLLYVKSVLHLFDGDLLALKEDDTKLTGSRSIKRAILDYLREKYGDPAAQELLNMVSFIDPRFRSTYATESKIEELKETALLPELPTSQSVAAATPTVEATPASKWEKQSLGSFFKQPVQQHTKKYRELIEAELSGCLDGVKPDGTQILLRWWKAHEDNCPRLSNVAKKYVPTPHHKFASRESIQCKCLSDASYPAWEDFVTKGTKLQSQLRTTILVTGSFLDAFQKVADMATGTRGMYVQTSTCK
ncbi:Metastasis suppressor protein 1 [Merluccius polli]|uniref:Metastasis suppressor protein 1 n=1 Tax=Merluccius polli TaxID=89951 RepID=A0AA47M9I8_MERPO|nr:Metastasis suppressor protein 1 [Merluccius polli]